MIQLSQENRQLRIDSPLGTDQLLIQSIEGTESMSRLFSYDAVVMSKSDNIDGDQMVGQLVSVTYHSEDGRQRNITGYVSRFEYLKQVEEPAKLTAYQLSMVPWLWFLRHNRDCRIFQEMKAPDIIQQIFDDLGFNDYEVSLNESYSEREYCVQYNESDFDFVSRLMEEEGIYYYFKHEDGNHKLVLSDSVSGYYDTDEPEVSYKPVGQEHFQQLASWRHVYEFRPGKVSQKDFNFKKPTDGLKTEESSKVNYDLSSRLEVYEYPGRYEEGGNGNRLTKVRREALDAEHDYAVGAGFYLSFSPGGKFKMKDHSRKSEIGKSHVLVEVYTEIKSNMGYGHEGSVDFQNQFRCIPAETVYRPPRHTIKPVVEGPQTAIVATDGQEIVVDEHARVKVQFHWDRYGKNDLDSSCWIRVSQVHAGKGWGMIDIPRQGEEVIVSFLNGDPDRPIITGRVYNGDNQPPYGLKGAGNNLKNKTRRGNTTKSYEASGYNEMTMDDTAGEEQIRIHAQYDMNSVIENDQTWHIKRHRIKDVDVDETMVVGNNQALTVGKDRSVEVGENHQEVVGMNQKIEIGIDHEQTIGSASEVSIGSSLKNTIGADQETVIGMNRKEQVGMNAETVVGGSSELKVAMSHKEQAADITIQAGMKVTVEAGGILELKCGASSIKLTPGMLIIQAPLVKIN